MHLLTVPFVALHGLDDKVTDPTSSVELFKRASSEVKNLHIYEGMVHILTAGQPVEDIQRVFEDISSFVAKVESKKIL